MSKTGLYSIIFFLILFVAIFTSIEVTFSNSDNISTTSNHVIVVNINGEISYGVSELVKEAIEEAEEVNGIVVLVLDTPGGLLDATIEIITSIRNSEVPVIGYVYPPGKGAWSAGTLILLATHIAAMAPGTLIGSLQPVYYNPATGEVVPTNESKIINLVLEYTTVLAKDRGRNVTAARAFVIENLNLAAEKALKYHVIEFIASSLQDLLEKINGYKVRLDNGREVLINTDNPIIEHYSGSIRVRLVAFLSDPVINGLLGTLGVLVLIFSILSGNYVAIPLAIGLVLLSLLGAGYNANYISLALMLIGALALGVEVVTPGFGVLGFSGILLIALGIALMPFYKPGWIISPEYQKMLFWTGISTGLVLGSIMGFILYKVIQAKRKPPTLKLDLLGVEGKAIDPLGPGKIGFVLVMGEYWRAKSDEEIKPGERVIVVGKEGTILIVKKKS